MSLLTKNKPSSVQPRSKDIDYSSMPQINLLPLEIIEKRNLKALQLKLAIYFLLFLVLLAGAFAFVKLEKKLADNKYSEAVAETARLKAEELKYAEVPLIKGQIEDAKVALRDGMYREILWDEYIGAIASTLPDEAVITEISVEAATLNDVGPASMDSLMNNTVGQLTFLVDVPELPDTTEWINKLNLVPGLRDARFGTATYTNTGDDPSFVLTGVVGITEDAYSGRFEPEVVEEGK